MPKPIRKVDESPRRPTTDWSPREVLDSGAEFRCERCRTQLRWVHVLVHDVYDGVVHVGKCCAKRLCYGYDAEGAEREHKNRAERLARFMNPEQWTRSRNNPVNICRTVSFPTAGKRARQGLVTVFKKNGVYGACIKVRGDICCRSDRYAEQAEAKAVAFELVEQLKREFHEQ